MIVKCISAPDFKTELPLGVTTRYELIMIIPDNAHFDYVTMIFSFNHEKITALENYSNNKNNKTAINKQRQYI